MFVAAEAVLFVAADQTVAGYMFAVDLASKRAVGAAGAQAVASAAVAKRFVVAEVVVLVVFVSVPAHRGPLTDAVYTPKVGLLAAVMA